MSDAPFTLIDCARSQGLPDWSRVAAQGRTSPGVRIDGVSLKATEGTSGAGSTVATFQVNAQHCADNGLPWGVYHFLSAFSPAEDQAAHFLETVAAAGTPPLRPMIDVERGAGPLGKLPTVDTLLAFVAALEAEGLAPIIYSAAWVAGPMGFAAHPELVRCPLWVASYGLHDPPVCAPWGAWGADDGPLGWQWTASGHVDGIVGPVDVSRFRAMPTAG